MFQHSDPKGHVHKSRTATGNCYHLMRHKYPTQELSNSLMFNVKCVFTAIVNQPMSSNVTHT